MANRVFQSVIYQMKDAIDRVVGVVDETGAVIACSELNLIGEVQEDFMAERVSGKDGFARGGYSYQQFSSAKHNDYAVFVEGADETAAQFAAVLAISLQSIKQYHDEKFDKANFIKNVVLDNILPGDIYAKARELHFATDVSRVVFIVRVVSGGDISAYDVVSSLFPDKQKDFVFNISETDTVLVKEIRKGIDRSDMEKLAASIVDTLSGEQPGHRPADLPAAHHRLRDVPQRGVQAGQHREPGPGDPVHHPALLREQPERVRDQPRPVRPPQHPGLPAGKDQKAHRPGPA